MAILMLRSKLLGSKGRAIGALTLGLALAGCVLFEGARTTRRSYTFSHRVHAEQELGCTDCHLAAETGDEPGMPGVGACRLCHTELDAEKPPERKVESLFAGKDFKTTKRGALDAEIVFPHLKHVAAGLECTACHATVPTNEDTLELPVPSMDACSQCHATRNVPNACSTCHTTLRADVAPPSHDALWTKRHGNVCRASSESTVDRCVMCHQPADCTTCHQTNPPVNHTNQWRRTGHGISAQLDRESCSTCHKPDTCTSCHSTTQPPNHRGAFGSQQNQHCITCHEPLQSEGCSACHAGTPSHALAQPKPAGHTPAMNCRQCHLPGGTLPPMPHVDDGSNCNRCHH